MKKDTKVAAVQMAPIYLDSLATTSKMCDYVEKAVKKEVELVVFPELTISMYPTYNSPEYIQLYKESSIKIPGPEIDILRRIAKKNNVYIVTGLIEKDEKIEDLIYNSSIIINNKGELIGKHRKIVIPRGERLFFKEGYAEDVKIFKTKIGNIGIAMCYEHLNPLYRRSLCIMGEQIHCALWVNTKEIKHIVDSTARVTAAEGVNFVIIASQVTPKHDKPGRKGIKGHPRQLLPFIGGSGILNPNGEYIAGPIYGKETIVYSNICLNEWQIYKSSLNPRSDLFNLSITK